MLLAIARAKDERQVDRILGAPFFKKAVWKPLGGNDNNYAIVSNQQSSPVNALCEKPVNSIDHVLIKRCLAAGDRPAGRGAPSSMSEALERYLGVPGGDISRLGGKEILRLAQNVRVMADGDKGASPNIVVADRGEGQEPDKFESTLLSLQKGNKRRIKFVQGKYNMGGTGVLPFCGARGYQLIAARRSEELEPGSEWGFTLVREAPGVSDDDKTPWYEYFAGPDGRICTAPPGPLEILPGGGALEDGCMVKMFNYEIAKASIARKLWSDMNSMLYAPPLPVMVEDARFRGPDNPRVMYGNRNLLEREFKRRVHRSFSIKSKLRGFGTSRLDVVVFQHASRSPDKKNAAREFRPRSGAILLTQNGQTHAALRQSKLDSESGLASLAEYMMVHVDLTCLPASKAKMFLASRDRIRQSADSKRLEERILEDIGEDGQVRALEAEYKKLDEQVSVKDSAMNRAIEDALKKDKAIAEMLSAGAVPADGGRPWEGDGDGREGGKDPARPTSYIPTYLRFKGGAVSAHRPVPADGSAAYAVLETDAPDDYTTRSRDAGELDARFPGALDGSPHGPFGGRVKVKMRGRGKPSEDAGDVIVTLTRPGGAPLSCVIHAIFVEPEKREKRSGVRLQSFKWIREDGWAGMGWTSKSVARAGKSEVLVNRDCEFLRRFQSRRPGSQSARIAEQFGLHVFLASVCLHAAHCNDANYDEIYEKSIEGVARSCLAASYGGAPGRPPYSRTPPES